MSNIRPGPRSTEFWATVTGSFTFMFGDRVIEIPDAVLADPELMTIVIVAKIVGVVVLLGLYINGRSRVKEAASRPAPLIGETIGHEVS